MAKKTNIVNVVLYAKHHYERSKNVWKDVLKCLEADTYTPGWEDPEAEKPETRNNILTIIIRDITERLRGDKTDFMFKLVDVLDENKCWEFGYFHDKFWGTKNRMTPEEVAELKPYDYKTAVLWFYLSRLQGMEIIRLGYEVGTFPEPSDKVLPLPAEEVVAQ